MHCGGYGVFHQRRDDSPALPMPDPAALAASPKFIPQIISSAIVNVPPPIFVLKALQLAGWKPKTVLEVGGTVPEGSGRYATQGP